MPSVGAAARYTAATDGGHRASPASQVAIDILAGGSALDGAIAANAALGLMEPTGNGIGGDIFFIIWDPKTEQHGYSSGRAPLGRRSLI